MEIESMERSGEAFRESPCFLGSFDWMHFSAFSLPQSARDIRWTSPSALPTFTPQSPACP